MLRNFKLSALTVLMLSCTAGAASAEIYYRGKSIYSMDDNRTTLSLSSGTRQNEFDWNIASDLTGTVTPNILSELTWSDIIVFEFKGKIEHRIPADYGIFKGDFLLEAETTGGRTVNGDNQDSDYNGDDRTLEFSRSNNNANRGFSYGGELAAGYQFNLAQRTGGGVRSYFTAGPIVGYGFHRQEYVTTEGNQTIPALGRFTGLDSTYTADWYGPFVGLQLNYEFNRHAIRLRGEQHFLEYDAEAQWNLRTDFAQDPSFVQSADDATGIELNLGYAYALDSFMDVTLDYTYTKREAEDGLDTVFFSNGTQSTQRLNEVNDESHALRLGLSRAW